MIRIITSLSLVSFLISCRTDLENKYYAEIPGLWQMKWEKDSLFGYQGCSEFFDNEMWRRHDGCTIAEGRYWFDKDTLFTTILNYTNFEDKDTNKALIIKLESGVMTTYDYGFTDTIYYEKKESGSESNCWQF